MKLLQRGLKKEDIANAKRYQRWYRVVDNEVRLFVNEELRSEQDTIVNKIDHRNDKAYLCMEDVEYYEEFYKMHKDLKVRLYVKSDVGSLYNEYAVSDWFVGEEGLELSLG